MADIISGGTPKTEISEYWNGDIPWLSVKDFSGDAKRVYSSEKSITEKGLNNSATQLLYPGDIIISARGTVGEVAQIGRAMAFNQSCYGLRAKDSYSSDFLYYVLKYQVKYLKAVANGAVFDTIVLNTFDKMKLYVPELYIQKKIAKILSAYDDLIEANNRRIELLEQTAQELYQEWFVRFRFPEHEKVKFENGLPEGWDVVKLGDYVEIKGGKRLPEGKSLCSEETEHPYIRIRDITSSKFICLNENLEYIDNETFDIIKRFTVKPKDILISIVGTIGAIACVGKSLKGANLTENCIKLININYFTSDFLYHFLNSDAGKGTIQAGIVGATQPKLPIYNIKRIKLLKPQIDVINKFTMMVEPIDQEIMNLMDHNRNLAVQRDLLLPRLISGKLEV
jgi:type I restriction enzyme S subunit